MASLHAEYLTEAEAYEVALPVLRKRLKPFGFESVLVKETEEFDGTNVFRMVARVQSKVPARLLINSQVEIRQSLEKKGEERFVNLSTERIGIVDVEDDED